MENLSSSKILVTGASGYIASHITKLLLERNYKVRGTVLSLKNKNEYEFLYGIVPEKSSNLELVEADLNDHSCWLSVLKDCNYVFSVAAPVPGGNAHTESEFVNPAVKGTQSILDAAMRNGVKRVVITSSVGAISCGNEDRILNESDWSIESASELYTKSKLKSEKAAWEFYEKNKGKIQVCCINPSFVFGPVFKAKGNSTCEFICDIIKGTSPGIIDTTIPIVDVREVAEIHLKAMFTDNAEGQRYICSSKNVSFKEIVSILKNEFEKYGYEIADKVLTFQQVKESNSMLLGFLPMIGKQIRVNNEKSIRELGIHYRSIEATLCETGFSLIKNGALPNKLK